MTAVVAGTNVIPINNQCIAYDSGGSGENARQNFRYLQRKSAAVRRFGRRAKKSSFKSTLCDMLAPH
jgi:hypothetical protein